MTNSRDEQAGDKWSFWPICNSADKVLILGYEVCESIHIPRNNEEDYLPQEIPLEFYTSLYVLVLYFT